MNAALIAVLVVVVLALVAGLGILIFRLQRRAQTVVPAQADRHAAQSDRVVGLDEQGREILESEDAPSAPDHDEAAFENVLSQSLHDLHPGDGGPPGEPRS